MFEQSIVAAGSATARTNRPWAFGLALVGQLIAVALLVLIPMFFVEALPPTSLVTMLTVPLPPPPPPPPLPPRVQARVHKTIPRKFDPKGLVAPVAIPKHVPLIEDLPPTIAQNTGPVGGVPGGIPGGLATVPAGIVTALPPPPAPPPPAPTAPVTPPERIVVGGQVQAALLVHQVQPRYPVLAKEGRIDGTVELKAIIGRDGTVQNLTVMSGHPFLVKAAINAVKQWIYKPTILNGKPVEVATEITVHFRLG